jgi:hypothetical protein
MIGTGRRRAGKAVVTFQCLSHCCFLPKDVWGPWRKKAVKSVPVPVLGQLRGKWDKE